MSPHSPGDRSEGKRKLLFCALALVVLVAVAWITYLCIPLMKSLSQPETQEQLRNWIASLGFRGWLIFLGLQMLQIIVAFIPGEPVQLLAGVLYGTWGGLATCLLGSVLASTLVFFMVRKCGEKLVIKLFGRNKLDEYAFLKDSKRSELIVLILFLIPGIPKDLLTYLGGLTRIPAVKFVTLTNLARIPALTASTLLGSSVSRGNLTLTLIVAISIAIIAAIFLIYREKFMAWIHRKNNH